MKYFISFLVVIIISLGFLTIDSEAQQSTTLILVRHAEKVDDSADPDLSPEGVSRATVLKNMLSTTGVTAVYSTDFIRTRKTCGPTADFYGLELKIYSHRNASDLDDILRQNLGGVVLVCGHSNSTPRAANHYLGEQKFEDFDESDYGNLFFLNFMGDRPPSVLRIRY